MPSRLIYELPEFSAILSFIDAIFADLNMGLFIYHLESPGDERSFRLIYANAEASRMTGADLRPLIGRLILDAFPALAATSVPATFIDVARTREPRRIEEVEYSDSRLDRASYSVKAFPMPSDCLGVLFERL